MGGNYPYDEGPRAKAITWEEWRRGGGGGGGPGGPDREPTWLGRKFREWACSLISREREKLEKKDQMLPAEFVERNKLTAEFNRLSERPGFDITMEAVQTVYRYTLETPFKKLFSLAPAQT